MMLWKKTKIWEQKTDQQWPGVGAGKKLGSPNKIHLNIQMHTQAHMPHSARQGARL